jgi:hypothetical protein
MVNVKGLSDGQKWRAILQEEENSCTNKNFEEVYNGHILTSTSWGFD